MLSLHPADFCSCKYHRLRHSFSLNFIGANNILEKKREKKLLPLSPTGIVNNIRQVGHKKKKKTIPGAETQTVI